MTVKKKINPFVKSFIDKGADVKAAKDKPFKNVLIRVPISILSDIDSFVEQKPWITRTHWIMDAILEKLKTESKNAR